MTTKTKRPVKPVVKPEAIVNDAPRTFTEADFPIGSVAHQGDLIFVRISSMPVAKARKNRQLADGNTQGSRHVLKVGDVFDGDTDTIAKVIGAVCRGAVVEPKYVGPVIRTVDGVADVVHPEHGDHFYRGDMVIACVFQRSMDAEERERRVVD